MNSWPPKRSKRTRDAKKLERGCKSAKNRRREFSSHLFKEHKTKVYPKLKLVSQIHLTSTKLLANIGMKFSTIPTLAFTSPKAPFSTNPTGRMKGSATKLFQVRKLK